MTSLFFDPIILEDLITCIVWGTVLGFILAPFVILTGGKRKRKGRGNENDLK